MLFHVWRWQSSRISPRIVIGYVPGCSLKEQLPDLLSQTVMRARLDLVLVMPYEILASDRHMRWTLVLQ